MFIHFQCDESAGVLGFVENLFIIFSFSRYKKGKEIVRTWGYLLLHYVEYEHLG